MAIRSLETPKRSVDIPQLVYYVRRGRASAVQTKEQYEFIYKVASMYAAKITNLSNDNWKPDGSVSGRAHRVETEFAIEFTFHPYSTDQWDPL